MQVTSRNPDKDLVIGQELTKKIQLHFTLTVRTNTLVILATYTEAMYPSVCVEAVEKLGESRYIGT